MKTKHLVSALIACTFFAFNSNAQISETDNNNCHNEQNGQCKKQHCKKGKKELNIANPFEGINLTEEQKIKIEQLNKSQKELKKATAKECKAQKMRNDSILKVNRVTQRSEYLNNLKTILSSDQYTQFLENYYINGISHKGNICKKLNRPKIGNIVPTKATETRNSTVKESAVLSKNKTPLRQNIEAN